MVAYIVNYGPVFTIYSSQMTEYLYALKLLSQIITKNIFSELFFLIALEILILPLMPSLRNSLKPINESGKNKSFIR